MKFFLAISFVLLSLSSNSQTTDIIDYVEYNVYHSSKVTINNYAKAFIEKNKNLIVKESQRKGIPNRYKVGTIYHDKKGVYIDAVIRDYGDEVRMKNLTIYGTYAFLSKEGRTRIELRNVFYIGDDMEDCKREGTFLEYFECMNKYKKKGYRLEGYLKKHFTIVTEKYKSYLVKASRKDYKQKKEIGDDW